MDGVFVEVLDFLVVLAAFVVAERHIKGRSDNYPRLVSIVTSVLYYHGVKTDTSQKGLLHCYFADKIALYKLVLHVAMRWVGHALAYKKTGRVTYYGEVTGIGLIVIGQGRSMHHLVGVSPRGRPKLGSRC